MSRAQGWTLTFVMALGASGAALGSEAADPRRCRGIEPNGPELNGTAMSRVPAVGCPSIGGIQLRVVELAQGVKLKSGQELRDVRVLEGALKSGTLSPRDFIGAQLSGVSETGPLVMVKIDDIAVAAKAPGAAQVAGGDLLLYKLSYQWRDAADKSSWAPLCKDGGLAVALPGQWDLTVGTGGGGKRSSVPVEVTFACQGSAIAKCVTQMGYRPWAAGPGGVSLEALHQSCVRAVRADYCGTGQSNTMPGEQVNFYDSAGLLKDGAEWPLEAQWTPDGARCVQSTRIAKLPKDLRTKRDETGVRDWVSRTCPKQLHACAAGPAGAVVITEVNGATPAK